MPDQAGMNERELVALIAAHEARLSAIEKALDGVGFAFDREPALAPEVITHDILASRAERLGALGERSVRAAAASRDTREVVELTWAAEELYAGAEELEAIAELTRSRP